VIRLFIRLAAAKSRMHFLCYATESFPNKLESCVKDLWFEPENRQMKHCLHESRVFKPGAVFLLCRQAQRAQLISAAKSRMHFQCYDTIFFPNTLRSCVKDLKCESENRQIKHCLQESRVFKSVNFLLCKQAQRAQLILSSH